MGSIANLLFGREAGGLLDLITGEGDSERDMADRAAGAAEWCGSTPGRGSADRQVGGAARPGRGRRGVIVIRAPRG